MENFIGGLLNGLLTGGILVGKICQALGGGSAKKFFDRESGITVVGDVSAGGVQFFRSNASGESMVYAFNPNTSASAMVTVPNEEGDEAGVTYIIGPTQKVVFAEAESPQVSPTVNVVTGLTNAPLAPGLGNPALSMFRLAFNGLRVGNSVNIGSFRLSCTTTQLVVVSTQITATAMTYMWLNSNRGVSVSNQNPIPPSSSSNSVNGPIEQHFNVDFAALGFDVANDVLDGQITLEAAASADLVKKLSKVRSEPLHPVEQEFFTRLARGKL